MGKALKGYTDKACVTSKFGQQVRERREGEGRAGSSARRGKPRPTDGKASKTSSCVKDSQLILLTSREKAMPGEARKP